MRGKGQEQGWVAVVLGDQVGKPARRSVIAQSGQIKKLCGKQHLFQRTVTELFQMKNQHQMAPKEMLLLDLLFFLP